jgi:YVTN family beta-propeller protein
VFDKRTRQVIGVIATGREPSGIALDPLSRRGYVALAGEDAVDVIDLMAGRVIDRIRLTPGDGPVHVVLTPDGRRLLSANRASNSVSIIDAESRAEQRKVSVPSGPRSILLDRLGRRAFVFCAGSSTVAVIDILGGAVTRSIATNPGPLDGQMNRRGDRLYVIHEMTPFVTVINPDTLTVTTRFPVRSAMEAIKIDPNTDFVYLAARRDIAVGVYDPFSFAMVDVMSVGASIARMTTDADENALYLVASDTNRVLVSHRIRKRVVGELDVGDAPSWISVMGEN